jgi:hypothetical protein
MTTGLVGLEMIEGGAFTSCGCEEVDRRCPLDGRVEGEARTDDGLCLSELVEMVEMLNESVCLFVVGSEGDFTIEILDGLNDFVCLFTVVGSSSSESEAPTEMGQLLSSSYRG